MSEKYGKFLSGVKAFMPSERIYVDELRRLAWGTDAGFYRLTPEIVLRSDNEGEISEIMKLASSHGLSVTFRAAGTSLSGQAVSDSILVVAASIGRIMKYRPTVAVSACSRVSSERV